LGNGGARFFSKKNRDEQPKSVLAHPTEIIKFLAKPLYTSKTYLSQLYLQKGMSIRKIAKHIDAAKSTVRGGLKQYDVPTRTKKRDQMEANYNPQQVPFGYRYLNGAIVPFKKEQEIIKLIRQLRRKDKYAYNAITKYLTSRHILTKRNKLIWDARNVQRIIAREGIE
jgi:transposase-like protein